MAKKIIYTTMVMSTFQVPESVTAALQETKDFAESELNDGLFDKQILTDTQANLYLDAAAEKEVYDILEAMLAILNETKADLFFTTLLNK